LTDRICVFFMNGYFHRIRRILLTSILDHKDTCYFLYILYIISKQNHCVREEFGHDIWHQFAVKTYGFVFASSCSLWLRCLGVGSLHQLREITPFSK